MYSRHTVTRFAFCIRSARWVWRWPDGTSLTRTRINLRHLKRSRLMAGALLFSDTTKGEHQQRNELYERHTEQGNRASSESQLAGNQCAYAGGSVLPDGN